MKQIYIFPLLALLLMAADDNEEAKANKLYANYEQRISFEYPQNWAQTAGQQTEAIIIQPKTEGDRFRENFNLFVLDDESMSLNDFTEESLEALTKNHHKFKMVSEVKKQKLGKNKYTHITYNHQTLGYPVTVDWYLTTKKEFIYSFTFSSEKDSASKYTSSYEEVVKSFNLKAKAPKVKKQKKEKEKKKKE